ncbi:MAG TPA: decaprenyl-phosphate phosphoribosyltransferase [Acidimicrobiales bacterium]
MRQRSPLPSGEGDQDAAAPAASVGPTTSGPGPGAPPETARDIQGARGRHRKDSLPAGLLRTARPRQWVKNVLVFAAPGAAGVLGHPGPFLRTLAAFGIFCVTASGIYFVNDALDQAADRLHPTKRYRPVASGVVPINLAYAVGGGLMVAGILLALLVNGQLALVMAIYVGITFAYNLWLKDEAVVDLAAVASGFVLRAIAGGVAAGVVLSNWFLIVASFGSLFMVAGKRHAEHLDLGDGREDHRATLGQYSLSFLRYVRSVASAVAIAGYCVWAFEKAAVAGHGAIWFQLSIAPFVLAVLRYALLLDAGKGGAPEDIVLGDRPIELMGAAWIFLFALGVYAV